MGSVKVTLSDGKSSPLFEQCDIPPLFEENFGKYEKIDFDPNVPIRAVKANLINPSLGIAFFNSKGEIVYDYDPGYYHGIEYYGPPLTWLEDNEELVGVYGIRHNDGFFENFGFIVKVK